jgi:hypothetical protein
MFAAPPPPPDDAAQPLKVESATDSAPPPVSARKPHEKRRRRRHPHGGKSLGESKKPPQQRENDVPSAGGAPAPSVDGGSDAQGGKGRIYEEGEYEFYSGSEEPEGQGWERVDSSLPQKSM